MFYLDVPKHQENKCICPYVLDFDHIGLPTTHSVGPTLQFSLSIV